jgi:adenine phosphoribosyltransferase
MDLKQYIRDVPDFPKPGVLFRDISPLLATPAALAMSVERIAGLFREDYVQKVLGMESRGFMFGAPVAIVLGAGFVPLRKPGKLPAATLGQPYDLEYGTTSLEIHQDALSPGERVVVVDDVLATGGTMEAAVTLARRLGAEVVGAAVVVELTALGGRRRLSDLHVESLVQY